MNCMHKEIRERIIREISENLNNKTCVHACWLGESDANNEVDSFSDIDLFLCVDDYKIDEIILNLLIII